jgi:hypothetical protein
MTRDPLERMTRVLRDATSDVGDVGALPPRRDEAITKLAEKIRERARADRRRTVIACAALAAGLLAIAGGTAVVARRWNDAVSTGTDLGRVRDSSGVTLVREGHAESAAANERVAEGTELQTSAGSEAHLEFESGTRVTVGGSTRVRLLEQRKKKRFALESGSIFAKVAKLAPEDRFVVATPDAEVEVRGTAFRVTLVTPEPSCADGTPTRLEVVEGVVVVRHAGQVFRVSAGESWPSCAVSAREGEPRAVVSPATASSAEVAPAGASPPGAHVRSAPSARASGSHLSEQNDLFDKAMRAKREGRSDVALATFDGLLKSYPNGPLAENASVERMRLLAASDSSSAAQTAREYLRRWPRGYARIEAESLAGTP